MGPLIDKSGITANKKGGLDLRAPPNFSKVIETSGDLSERQFSGDLSERQFAAASNGKSDCAEAQEHHCPSRGLG